MRRLGRLAAAVGFFVLLVAGGTLVVLCVSLLIGYLPYSDRPGPGWHAAGLSAEDLKFFLSWERLLLPSVAIWGLVLGALGQVLGAFRAPRWFVAIVGAVLGGYLSLLTVAGVGWYIAIAAVPVYAAGLAGAVFGALLLPRYSLLKKDTRTTRAQWIGILGTTVGVIVGIYLLILAPRYSQQLSIEFARVDPGGEPLEPSLKTSGLNEAEKALIQGLFPKGVLRFGMSGSLSGGEGPQARMLVVVTGPLLGHNTLRQPKGGAVVYVQSGSEWRRYPEGGKLLSQTVEFWPTTGKPQSVTVRYGPGPPTDFMWFIPRASQ
jgi:hypothetical protein